jgi:hypothetical protein
MTTDLPRAATALADILARENTALADLNLTAATALLAGKSSATEALIAAHARHAAGLGPAPAFAAALGDLAAENRRLLERALAIQGQVLDIIAQAVPRASAQAPRYGNGGALVGISRALPVAIAASA